MDIVCSFRCQQTSTLSEKTESLQCFSNYKCISEETHIGKFLVYMRNIMYYAGNSPPPFPSTSIDLTNVIIQECIHVHKFCIDMLFSTILYNIKPKYHRGESTQRYFNTRAPCGKPRAFLFISRAKLPVRHCARLRFAILIMIAFFHVMHLSVLNCHYYNYRNIISKENENEVHNDQSPWLVFIRYYSNSVKYLHAHFLSIAAHTLGFEVSISKKPEGFIHVKYVIRLMQHVSGESRATPKVRQHNDRGRFFIIVPGCLLCWCI